MLKVIFPIADSTAEGCGREGGLIQLQEINQYPILKIVLDNVDLEDIDYELIFLVNRNDAVKFGIDRLIELAVKGRPHKILKLGPTGGSLCSVMMAANLIQEGDDILILNSDHTVEHMVSFIKLFRRQDADAGCLLFESMSVRWAYASVVGEDLEQVFIKETASGLALLGFFYFKSWADFLAAAKTILKFKWETKGRYYVPSVLNSYIVNEKRIAHVMIPNNSITFYGAHNESR